MRKGYTALYEAHENVHDLSDDRLRDVIIQATGWESSSSNVRSAMGSFKALCAYADFENDGAQDADDESVSMEQNACAGSSRIEMPSTEQPGIKLAYTINLNLPTTTDIAVFNAIFKSLKEHLL